LLRRADAVTAVGKTVNGLDQLVIAACDATRDLAALEQHLGAFDARRDRLAEARRVARCPQSLRARRDLLTQRLLEASAA